MGQGNAANVFALVAGAVYAVVGLVGFVATEFNGFVTDGPDALLGFDLNMFHNIVHLGIGLIFLAAAALDPVYTQGIVIGGGLVYILAALLGFVNELQILSINDEVATDNFLHLISGSAAVLFGLVGARQSDAAFGRRARGA